MAKARVDADSVLGKLVKGISPAQIAREYGVSRQAIDLWKNRFLKEGLLKDMKKGELIKDVRDVPDYEILVSNKIDKWLNEILLPRIEKKIFESVMVSERAQDRDKRLRLLEEAVNKGYKKEIKQQRELFLELIKQNANLINENMRYNEEMTNNIQMTRKLAESKKKGEIGEI